ncbi:MAG TPA: TonB-dependent receptor [Kofleriaceae bacterium]|nr:TonB-dependent receptor [Kofleriaceae bacterium]
MKPTPRDRAAPSSLALPARLLVWPSLPRLTLWWHGAQPAGGAAQPAPAQPAPAPTTPEETPAAEPAPAPAEPAPAPEAAPAEASPTPAQPAEAGPTDAEVIAQAQAELEAGGGDQEGEVIVVTGSAIERKETTTAAPVSVVDKEELDASGLVTIGDILQNLPANSNAINVQFNNGGDGSTRVDLRGLGAERTLVLLNGRRHVPGGTGADASVDLNAIPLAVIKRVEVLKDGASAVYGSDAIGGVVNIITRDDFDGTEANIYTGTTQHTDGTIVDASFVTGQASRRGNVVFSGGYSDQKPIFSGDRDFSEVAYEYDFATGALQTSGSYTTPNGWIYDASVPGSELCPNQDTAGCTPDGNGGFRDFDASGSSDRTNGDLYNFQPENYLLTPLRRYNVFSTGNYRFHENVRGFFEASYMNRKSVQRLAPEPLGTETEGIPFSADSIYNNTGIDINFISRRMIEAGPRIFSQNLDTFRVVTGLDGRLPSSLLDGWKWEGSFNYGRTQGSDVNQGRLVRSRVRQAIGPSYLDNGVPKCGTMENPGDPDCVPLNLLGGVGTITPQMLDYIQYTGNGDGFTQQRTFLGQVSGPIVKTPWNGDIVLAVGADYREEAGGSQPDPLTASGDTTGNKADPTFGDYNVKEGFAELSIVPVTGEDWAKWLEVNLAARAVDYNTFGNAFTWKAGGLWRFAGGLAVRGTYSTAFRAPSIGELFSGQADSFPGVSDPCDTSDGPITDANVRANCAEDLQGAADTFIDDRAQLPSRVGGNPNVDAETAKVFTTGAVFEPDYVEGLGVSVDYFNVKIDDAIQQAGASVLLANCYNQAPGSRADCDKIIRGATGRISSIIDTQTNIGGTETDGIDFNVNYEHAYPEIGRFRHNLEGTWLHKYDAVFPDRTVHAVGVYDLEAVFPRYKVNFSTMWGLKGVGLGVNARYIHSIRECDGNDCAAEGAEMADRKVKANVTGDAFAQYTLKSPVGQSTLTVGVNNVTNQNPPIIYNGFLATSDAATYDYLGRYFYARFTQLF